MTASTASRWRWPAAACSGLLLALAFPSPDLHLLVWVGLVPLLLALRGAGAWRRWWLGWLAGFVWRLGSLYWIAHVMHVYGGMSPVVAAGVAALLAFWMALNVGLMALLAPRCLEAGGVGALGLAAAWVGLEYLQTQLPFGFPWSLLGYAAGRSSLLMQSADLFGVWGLSLLAVFVNGAIAQRIVGGRRGLPAAAMAAAMLVAAGGYGVARLAAAPAADAAVDAPGALRVAAVQGNVEQGSVWDPSQLAGILQEHVALTLQAVDRGADLVVWSESSAPVRGGLEGDPGTRNMLAQLARQHGVTLVVGSPHFERDESGGPAATNAAFLITAAGEWTARYDKVQLVPFGEYVPVAWLFRFVSPLVDALIGFRRGAADQELLADPEAGVPPFAMAICYEIVFPDPVRRQVRRGATFLATITNDAWFGDTGAPYQHFAMARLRAVENRRWLVRAANTGISGVVDPFGRVVARSELDRPALIDAVIVPSTSSTPYQIMGDALARVCVVLGAAAALLAWRRRSPPPPPIHPAGPAASRGHEKGR